MESPTVPFEALLATSKRVLRNQTTLQDLIAAYPALKQKSLSSPSSLTDAERRMILDLPDPDLELANIKAVTDLSRAELIEKAVRDSSGLTQEEVVLLMERFWTPPTDQEASQIFTGLAETTTEAREEYLTVQQPAYYPNEEQAFSNGMQEFYRRERDARNERLDATANAALPYAKEWIQHIYREGKQRWGFICLYDAASQTLDPGRIDDFRASLSGHSRVALQYNGTADIISDKWQLLSFNAPNMAFASAVTSVDDDSRESGIQGQDAGAIFRTAFQEIVKDPEQYHSREDVTSTDTYTGHLKDGIPASGILTNTFLVFDPIGINTIISDPPHFFDGMRVLAFDADYPVRGKTYAEGYQGYTWVRLDQLLYNFYELRSMRADEVGMDEIWKAAQESPNRAFVSMDLEEAGWTRSNSMIGYTRDSVLGKRWYAMKDAGDERMRR